MKTTVQISSPLIGVVSNELISMVCWSQDRQRLERPPPLTPPESGGELASSVFIDG
ncbi:MAG: hypothetical protein JJ978_10505 [Roseivirga sp.]|nr:hypothetical protein [Roseivirga sp.]